MTRIRFASVIACIVCLSVVAQVTLAGVQLKKTVCRLTVDGWDLEEKDGRLGLQKFYARMWLVNSPTIVELHGSGGTGWYKTNKPPEIAIGRFMAADPEEKDTEIRVVQGEGESAHWVFEFVDTWKPEGGHGDDDYLRGAKGARFKLQLAKGRYKGWYVGVDPLSDEAKRDPKQPPSWRALKLVKDPKAAAEFKYDEAEFKSGGK